MPGEKKRVLARNRLTLEIEKEMYKVFVEVKRKFRFKSFRALVESGVRLLQRIGERKDEGYDEIVFRNSKTGQEVVVEYIFPA